jgi:hypothetical protein
MKLRFALFLTLFATSFAMVFSSVSWAADSGCGLGSVIIQKNSKGLQLLSMTTNSFLFTQPLGITSGTSGCSSSGIVQNDRQIEYFVEVNHDDLSREMAQGSGEKLKTLAALHGCMSSESQSTFGAFTQKSYSKIVTSASTPASEIVQNLRAEMTANGEIAQACEMAKTSSL